MRPLLSICLLLFMIVFVYAQDETAPIIVVKNDGIYAVSPNDGTSNLLASAPRDFEAISEYSHSPAILTSAEWLSPDGQYLAYRMVYALNINETIHENSSFTQQIFLMDLTDTSNPYPLELGQGGVTISSLAWSLDGQLLFLLVNNSVKVFERSTWLEERSIELNEPVRGMSRSIFAYEAGVVVMDRGIEGPAYQFVVYSNEGEERQSFGVGGNFSPDVNLYINTPFTPLEIDGQVHYGFVHAFSNYLTHRTDFVNGEIVEAEFGYPAMLSRSAVDDSLRLFTDFYGGDYTNLLIFDSDNNYLETLYNLEGFAYGILGDSIGSTFALSPDGQSLAYLDGDTLTLWEDGEERSLDIDSEIVVWASPIYIPLSPDYFRS